MQNPQALPVRTAEVFASDPEQLSAVQPERRREYVQIAAGAFRGSLRERSSGSLSMLQERWSCAMRVRCGRPRSFVAFSVVVSSEPASWCGVALRPISLLVLEHDWELTSRAPLESFSFAIERGRLEQLEAQLGATEPSNRVGDNRVLTARSSVAAAARLRQRLRCALAVGELPPAAQRALEIELEQIAVQLHGCLRLEPSQPASGSRRRAAVRVIEEYLEASERAVLSLPELCAIAGVSERTLEYAFREQLGTTPLRYLRLRRLNGVRRELLRAEPRQVRITEVAMRWGFWELGRFAREYRALFGELPSETLATGDRGGLRRDAESAAIAAQALA